VLVALGGTARVWRTDRMATIVAPQTGRITPDAAALAKRYGAQIAVCPARRAQRKGVVEKAIQYLTRSWWRTAAVATPSAAWTAGAFASQTSASGPERPSGRSAPPSRSGCCRARLPGADRGRAQGGADGVRGQPLQRAARTRPASW
jgi:hypothetical protein